MSRARPRACPRARCFASCFWAPGAGADCVQVSFGNHVALLLSCWKKQKKFVIKKRPSGVFVVTVTERDRAVWSPSPARAVASRRPGGSARCLGSRSAPPGLCACVALLRSEPSEPSSSGRKAGRWRQGRCSARPAPPVGRALVLGCSSGLHHGGPERGQSSLPPSPAPGVGEPGSRSQTRRSPPPQHPCGRRPARPALSVTGKVLALR